MNDTSDQQNAPDTGKDRSALLADAALVGVALIWGINIPIMKTGLEQVDAYVFNALRLIVSAIVLAAFAFHERRTQSTSWKGITKRQMLIYAVMVAALYQMMFLMGIDRTTSGNTALIIATVPMWTALMARVFIGETLRVVSWVGLSVALVGTVIVAMQKGDVQAGREQLLGNLIVLFSALCWSAGTVYSRPLLRNISPLQLSATAAVIALPIHIVVSLGQVQSSIAGLQSINVWLIILYAGVLSSGLALPMWNYGVRRAGAAHAAVIQNLIPLVAIAVAWLSRDEPATRPQYLGGALILGGLITMRMARWNREKSAAG